MVISVICIIIMAVKLFYIVENNSYVIRIENKKVTNFDAFHLILFSLFFVVIFFTKTGLIALAPIAALFINFKYFGKNGAYLILSVVQFLTAFFILFNTKYNIVDLWAFLR
jgi:hypothetical protein